MHLLIRQAKRFGFIAAMGLVAVSTTIITRLVDSTTVDEETETPVEIVPTNTDPVTATWIRTTTVADSPNFFFKVEFTRDGEPIGVGDVEPDDFSNLGTLTGCVFLPSKAQLAERQTLESLRAIESPMAEYPTVYNVMVTCTGASTGTFLPAFTPDATVAIPFADVGVENVPDQELRKIDFVDVVATKRPVLMVTKTGGGYVSSTTSSFQCGEICSDTTPLNKAVSLRARPYLGMIFAGWSGSCSGTGLCNLKMSKSHWVGALFEPGGGILLEKMGTGTGSVTSKPAGVLCPETTSSCSTWHADGTLMTLTATATKKTRTNPGSTFIGWSGACFGTGTCTVLIDSDSDPIPVYAIFKRN